MGKMTLRELTDRAGGEFIRQAGRYAVVRWDIDTVTLESRKTLEAAVDEAEYGEQVLCRDVLGLDWPAKA
jgi:hypothetical protein